MEGCEDGAPFFERFHVCGLVVRRSIFPAMEQDSNPLKCQRTNDRVELLAFSFVVIDVITGPLAIEDRKPSKLVKGLPNKFGTSLPEVDDFGLATALGHRSDP